MHYHKRSKDKLSGQIHISWQHLVSKRKCWCRVDIRIAKASASFGRLNSNVWNRRGITVETKLKVYRALVLPTLIYVSEAWTTYKRHLEKLKRFHLTCLRKIHNIKSQDKIPDTEGLTRADLPSIHTIQMQSQLRWVGHVSRMEDSRIPKGSYMAN